MSLFTYKIRLIESDFFEGFTDWHSHILPGVDDGVKELEEALEILHYFKLIGIRKVFLTPHMKNGVFINKETLSAKVNLLRQSIKSGIELYLSAEYMLDSGFEERFKYFPLYLNENHVLVETFCFFRQDNFYELLYHIYVDGNIPVIAHPERYLYMEYHDYYKMKNNGYSLQLSLLSLSGYYGEAVKKRAKYLLAQNMYDCIGTDIHNFQIFKVWLNKLGVTKEQLKMLLSISR